MTCKKSILFKLVVSLLQRQSKISICNGDKLIKELEVTENNIFDTLIGNYIQNLIINRMLGYYMRECKNGR